MTGGMEQHHAGLDAALARTAPDAARPAANVTDVLTAHLLRGFECSCGWRANNRAVKRGDEWVYAEGSWHIQHAAHVAAILEAGPVAEAERRGAEAVLAAVEAACGSPTCVDVAAARRAVEGLPQ